MIGRREEISRIGLCAVLAATALLSSPAPARSAVLLQYESTLPATPRCGRPTAVTIDAATSAICVTDEASQSIDIYDAQDFHQFRTDDAAKLAGPEDACLDDEGGLVFTDAVPGAGRTIRRLDLFGEPLPYAPERPQPDWCPGHLIVTRDGNFVSIDQRTGLITKHAAETGALIWQLALAPDDPEMQDLLGRPAEAADGSIYIPGGRLRRVLVLSADGAPLTTFGVPGAKRGEFAFPVGVAFGSDATVLVLDRMRHRVLAFDASHTFLGEYGRLGEAPGSLYHPVALAASADGRVLVAQGYQGRIQAFRLIDTSPVSRAPDLTASAVGDGASVSE